MGYIGIMIRFSFYGLVTFAAFGYLLKNPYVTTSPASIMLMLYLGLAGAVSFFLSAGAVIALYEIVKELMGNE